MIVLVGHIRLGHQFAKANLQSIMYTTVDSIIFLLHRAIHLINSYSFSPAIRTLFFCLFVFVKHSDNWEICAIFNIKLELGIR